MSRYPFFRKSYVVGVDGKFLDCLKSQPSTRRLRWILGRADRVESPFAGWFATGMQIRANMQTAQMGDGRWILVERELPRNKIDGVGLVMALAASDSYEHYFYRSRNKLQGWRPDGMEINTMEVSHD